MCICRTLAVRACVRGRVRVKNLSLTYPKEYTRHGGIGRKVYSSHMSQPVPITLLNLTLLLHKYCILLI